MNSIIGVIRSIVETQSIASLQEVDQILEYIQNRCFIIGAQVASSEISTRVRAIKNTDTQQVEQWIEQFENQLPELHNFILPGGDPLASQLFLARAICRRAERSIVRLDNQQLSGALIFTNRLSDLLFLLARSVNQAKNKKETIWVSHF